MDISSRLECKKQMINLERLNYSHRKDSFRGFVFSALLYTFNGFPLPCCYIREQATCSSAINRDGKKLNKYVTSLDLLTMSGTHGRVNMHTIAYNKTCTPALYN